MESSFGSLKNKSDSCYRNEMRSVQITYRMKYITYIYINSRYVINHLGYAHMKH